MAFPAPLLENLRVFGCPAEVLALDNVVRQAQVGMLARSGVWAEQLRFGPDWHWHNDRDCHTPA